MLPESDTPANHPSRLGPASLARRLGRVMWVAVLAAYLTLCVLVLVLKWWVIPQLPQYTPEVEVWLSQQLERPVRIDQFHVEWSGLSPEVSVSRLQIAEPSSEQGGAEFSGLRAVLSWRSLLSLSPKFSVIDLQRLQLSARRDRQGNYWLAGQRFVRDGSQGNPALDWLLRQGDVQLHRGVFSWRDYMGLSEETTPADVDFEVQAQVQNKLGQHALSLKAESPAYLNQPFLLSAQFSTPLWLLNLDNSQHWTGKAYVKADLLNLQPVGQWLKSSHYEFSAEGLNTEVWADFDKGVIQNSQMSLSLKSLKLDDPTVQARSFQVRNLRTGLNLSGFKPAQLEGQLTLLGFAADLQDGAHIGPVDAVFSHAGGQEKSRFKLALKDLDAGRVQELANVLLPHLRQVELNKALQAFEVSGQIRGLELAWSLPLRLDDVQVSFQNLSLYQLDRRNPQAVVRTGVSRLTGQLAGNEQEGRWQIDESPAEFKMPYVFEQADKALSLLQAKGSWKHLFQADKPAEWTVDELQAHNADADIRLKASYQHAPAGAGKINVQGQILRADVASVGQYLPLRVGTNARAWVATHLKSGTGHSGVFVLRGALKDFPYEAPGVEGEFKVAARVREASLTYSPGWPLISGIDGDLLFQGKRMLITADKALTSNVTLNKVRVEIPNLDAYEPVLDITGNGTGELRNMLQFVQTSPVSQILNKVLDDAKATGPSELRLKLSVPLAKVETTQVKGLLSLNNNSLQIVRGMPWVNALQGQIEFSNQGLQLKGVKGLSLGALVEVSGGTQKNGYLDIRANGVATAAGLAEYLNPLVGSYLHGETPFSVQVLTDANKLELHVKSRLEGLQIDLPHPFNKARETPLDFDLLQQSATASEVWKVRVGPEQNPLGNLKAVYGNKAQANGLQYLVFALGSDLPTDTTGTSGRVNVDTLDVDAWKAAADDLMGKLPQGQRIDSGLMGQLFNQAGDGLGRVRVDLKARQLIASKKTFNGMALTAKTIENRWQVELKGQGVDGYFSWLTDAQRPDGALLARFKTLTIPKSVDSGIKDIVDEPVNSIPALDIRVDRFVLGENELGRLRVVALNQTRDERLQARLKDQPNLWKLEELRIENPESVTVAKGTWQYGKGMKNQKTAIQLQQDVSDAGGLLSRFGMGGVFKGGKGTLTGELSWNDAPSNLDYGSLSGKLKLNSKNGQFLKADPGVAKLLGVLSLQSFPRRFALDFKDVFSEGFVYDTLEADIDLDKGVGKTPNFKMVGPAATVLMEGTLNLEKETQNLKVVVLPDLNPAGGSLIYSVVAANPAVGIASLIADFLLKDPLAKIFSFEYKVTGSWTQPDIARVSRQSTPSVHEAP